MSTIGDPRQAGETGPAGDQRKAGEEGPAGDTRPAGEEKPKGKAADESGTTKKASGKSKK